MIIKFDKNSLHVQVLCGILEKYEPNDDIQSIYDKVESLKRNIADIQEKIVGPALKEIEDLVAAENRKYIIKKADEKKD